MSLKTSCFFRLHRFTFKFQYCSTIVFTIETFPFLFPLEFISFSFDGDCDSMQINDRVRPPLEELDEQKKKKKRKEKKRKERRKREIVATKWWTSRLVSIYVHLKYDGHEGRFFFILYKKEEKRENKIHSMGNNRRQAKFTLFPGFTCAESQ